MSITTLTRRFKFNATILNDAAPHLTPIESLRLYTASYGFLATATLGEPVAEGEFLTYPVLKPEVQTKGNKAIEDAPSDDDLQKALAALEDWGAEEQTPTVGGEAVCAVFLSETKRVMQRDDNPLMDSILIPMA